MAVVECRSSMPSSGRLSCDSRPGSKVVDPPLLPSYSDVYLDAHGAGSPLGLSPSEFWGTTSESWKGAQGATGFRRDTPQVRNRGVAQARQVVPSPMPKLSEGSPSNRVRAGTAGVPRRAER